jgi:hypothetical protein
MPQSAGLWPSLLILGGRVGYYGFEASQPMTREELLSRISINPEIRLSSDQQPTLAL